MALHSYSKILLHFIWGIHHREKLISETIKLEVENYLINYSKKLDCYPLAIYANSDHVHLLIDILPSVSAEELIKKLKGSSSHFVNQERLTKVKFKWARGYAVFSVSESIKNKVKDYILNQEEHHRIRSYAEEVEMFLKKHDLTKQVNR